MPFMTRQELIERILLAEVPKDKKDWEVAYLFVCFIVIHLFVYFKTIWTLENIYSKQVASE